MEAILLRNLPEGVGEVYVWKKYTIQENVSYTWNRWSVVSTTTYKWNKWSTDKIDIVKKYYGGSSINSSDPPDMVNGYPNITNNDRFYKNAEYLSGPRIWKLSSPTSQGVGIYQTSYNSGGMGFRAYDNNDVEFPFVFTYLGSSLGGGMFRMMVYDNWQEANHEISSHYIEDLPDSTDVSKYPSSGFMSDGYWYAKSNKLIKGSTSYGQVTSISSTAYPSNGVSGSYWYESAGSSTSYSKGSTQYSDVSSTDPNAYPNGSYSGSYWYDNRQEVITYSMGSYIEDVFSTNPKRYPENGIDGSYWYVLQS